MRWVLRGCLGFAALVIAAGASPSTAHVERAGVELPARVALGNRDLRLALCGIRHTLWIEHYVAALYVTEPDAVPSIVPDAHQPKLIRIHVLSADWMPSDIPRKYRTPLQAGLKDDLFTLISRQYRGLSAGDVITISYMPERGITLSVNGRELLSEPGHALIDAMLEAWSDGKLIPPRVRRMQQTHRCDEARP